MNNDFVGHEWGELSMISTSDSSLVKIIGKSPPITLKSPNHLTRDRKKSLFTETNVLFYFLHAILCHKHNSAKTIIGRSFRGCR